MVTMNRAHRKKSEVDDKTKAKMLSLFTEHAVTVSALQERFGLSNEKVVRVLDEAGVVRHNRRDRKRGAST